MVVIGVGSELRGDDVAGLLVARRLGAWAARAGAPGVLALEGGAAPENFTGEIVRFRPELVVLVDAAHLAAGPGAVEVIPPEQVQGASFSTHMLPVPIFLDYLRHMTGCRTLVIGIGLAHKDVLAPPHPAVRRAVRRVVERLKRLLATPPPPTQSSGGRTVRTNRGPR